MLGAINMMHVLCFAQGDFEPAARAVKRLNGTIWPLLPHHKFQAAASSRSACQSLQWGRLSRQARSKTAPFLSRTFATYGSVAEFLSTCAQQGILRSTLGCHVSQSCHPCATNNQYWHGEGKYHSQDAH
jgi:hypothetical protein